MAADGLAAHDRQPRLAFGHVLGVLRPLARGRQAGQPVAPRGRLVTTAAEPSCLEPVDGEQVGDCSVILCVVYFHLLFIRFFDACYVVYFIFVSLASGHVWFSSFSRSAVL